MAIKLKRLNLSELNDSLAEQFRALRKNRVRIVFDCRMANDAATINKESTNENITDFYRWADARRLRINGKPCP